MKATIPSCDGTPCVAEQSRSSTWKTNCQENSSETTAPRCARSTSPSPCPAQTPTTISRSSRSMAFCHFGAPFAATSCVRLVPFGRNDDLRNGAPRRVPPALQSDAALRGVGPGRSGGLDRGAQASPSHQPRQAGCPPTKNPPCSGGFRPGVKLATASSNESFQLLGSRTR